MKEIVARDPVRLGIARCFQLAWSGLGHRLFRSSVTVAILTLAVAFLGHMLAFGVLESTTQRKSYYALESQRELGEVLARASSADDESAIMNALGASLVPRRLDEYLRWSGRTQAELASAALAAREARLFAEWLRALTPAAHAALAGDASADELLVELRGLARMQRFTRAIAEFSVRDPLARTLGDDRAGNQRELETLVNERLPKAKELVRAISAGHAAAIATLSRTLGDRSSAEVARDAPATLRAALEAAGFDLRNWRGDALSAFARRQLAAQDLAKALLKGNLRAEVARATDLGLGAISSQSVLDYVGSDAARARWLSELLARAAHANLSPALVTELAETAVRERALARAAGDEPPVARSFLGISPQNRWLVLLSFLVCAVGVANAMLMSVTERFTEIATMKCLGALDGFVMTMFLLEAAIEGGIGGAVGVVLGVLLAWLRGLVEYGSVLSVSGSGGSLAAGLGLAWLAGMVLAAVAAVGPSAVAARLAPMEAMRVD